MKTQNSIKMRMLLAATLALTSVSAKAESEGTNTGGGGLGVTCKSDGTAAFPRNGLYALDYVLAMQKNSEWYEYSSNVDETLKAIVSVFETELKYYFPREAINPDLYLALTENYSLKKIALGFDSRWKPLSFKLVFTNDQASGLEAENCQRRTVQLTTKTGSNYFYNTDAFSQLNETGLMQVNAHKIHEFLRTLTNDSNDIAIWNQAIHSQWFYKLKGEQLAMKIDSLAKHRGSIFSQLLIEEGRLRMALEQVGISVKQQIVAKLVKSTYNLNLRSVVEDSNMTSSELLTYDQFIASQSSAISSEIVEISQQLQVYETERVIVESKQLCDLVESEKSALSDLLAKKSALSNKSIALDSFHLDSHSGTYKMQFDNLDQRINALLKCK